MASFSVERFAKLYTRCIEALRGTGRDSNPSSPPTSSRRNERERKFIERWWPCRMKYKETSNGCSYENFYPRGYLERSSLRGVLSFGQRKLTSIEQRLNNVSTTRYYVLLYRIIILYLFGLDFFLSFVIIRDSNI